MAPLISIFLGPAAELHVLVNLIEDMFGKAAEYTEAEEGCRYTWHLLDIEVVAFDEHGLVDDCGIEFTRMPVEIDFVCFQVERASDEMQVLRTALANYTAVRLSHELSVTAVVVQGLQAELNRYSPDPLPPVSRPPCP